MTYVWSSISSLEGECRVASPSRQLWQFPHTFIVIVVITGNTYRCQHHSPTFNVRIYLQNPSKKSTYVHSFTNLLTHTHIYIYIYMYISHIQYILYHIQYYHISWQTFPSLQLELLPEGPLRALQEATVPLWQCEGWDDHLLAGGATLRDDFGGLENHGFPHQKSSLKALKPT